MSVPHSLIEQEDGPEVARSACCGAKKQTCVICTITLCPRYPEQHRCFHLSAPEIHGSCGPWLTWMCTRVRSGVPAAEGRRLFLKVLSSCRTHSLQDTPRALHGLATPHRMSGRSVCRSGFGGSVTSIRITASLKP